MLNVSKIQLNTQFGSSMLNSDKKTQGTVRHHEADKFDEYKKMNKAVYSDYVAGDISLIHLLSDKFEDLWNILTKRNPNLELKAQMIEEDLLREAQKAENMHRLSYYGMVA